MNHAGDEPPEDWEPTATEQDDIIRALSPPGHEPDPDLLAAQSDGAFRNIGTPRGSARGSPPETPRRESRELSTLSILLPSDAAQVVETTLSSHTEPEPETYVNQTIMPVEGRAWLSTAA